MSATENIYRSFLDNDLKRSTHIEAVYMNITRYTGIFYKTRNKSLSEALEPIY
jgi:hypothetical protein